ncbi:two-component regulator propeller domain-containing protein [Pseudomarimonas arenosa]|uniref:Two component regulator with propeller domain n=1 Tax=Pseudomarimonas arenosa TaxID=2774145 RepID=A0AAW3ZLW1_9GAMM|nr:two-component regulator propeller domain-containing protein [Pseudomarimonas arenosa]MBD8526733.1 hypothetical protein [Pseudomarimonas arenosa]
MAVERARVVLALAGLALLALWLAWMPTLDHSPVDAAQKRRPASALAPGLQTQTAARPAPLRLLNGCLTPMGRQRTPLSLELPTFDSWQLAAAGGERLKEDPCGNIWALWFNHWAVFVGGDPEHVTELRLPNSATLGHLDNTGLTDFALLGSELWVLGRAGQIARLDMQGWQAIEAPPGCGSGQLMAHEGFVWLSCHPLPNSFLGYWETTQSAWIALPVQGPIPPRLALGQDQAMYLLLGDRLQRVIRHGQGWSVEQVAATQTPTLIELSDQRLRVHAGSPNHQLSLEQPGLTGAALTEHGLFTSVSGLGLRFHDGQRWHTWSHAEGLPEDEARGLLIDKRERLWLAGTPVAVIDAAAAAEQIVRLKSPPPMPGTTFEDACTAAREVLAKRPSSGQVAQEHADGQLHVFFGGRQVCPNPWQTAQHNAPLFARRSSDGALLRVDGNGHQGQIHCGSPCDAARTAVLRRQWQLQLWLPQGPAAAAPMNMRVLAPPTPLPTSSPGPLLWLAVNGDVWISTRQLGLYHHDGKRWHHYGQDGQWGPDNAINDLIEDDYGRIWVASQPRWQADKNRYAGSTLHRFENGQWQHLQLAQEIPTAWSAQALAAIPEGIVAAGNGSALWIDGQNIAHRLENAPNRFASFVAVDAARYWWFAHGSREPGVSIRDAGRWGRLSTREGLFSNRIRQLAHDAEHRIWMLSENGEVAVYPRQTTLDHIRW